ncbi:hypothetical protein FKG96_22330 [Olivibacter sp. LS-1]|uniref:hypothetical protein n=1 Tax=Olivibacter sp. LS-1 TaxID=2592345 RepID=UPI0011EB0C23|nr:hypothetical protein [Olivibacter sp. LS-1]QEL03450.1 hypothetical protein FKG96_22330 [Olivibacter sp. LS-1]
MLIIVLGGIKFDSSVSEWLSSLSTFATLMVAVYALFQWKEQKQYDVQVEALSVLRVSADVVRNLRNPISSSGEINEKFFNAMNTELEQGKMSQNVIHEIYVFQSRMLRHEEDLKRVYQMKERLWATFGDNHYLTNSFETIAKRIKDINNAYHKYAIANQMKDNLDKDMVRTELANARKIMYGMSGDEISKELDDIISKADSLKKRKPTLF